MLVALDGSNHAGGESRPGNVAPWKSHFISFCLVLPQAARGVRLSTDLGSGAVRASKCQWEEVELM